MSFVVTKFLANFFFLVKSIAILYSTVDGQTKKICEFLTTELEQKNFKVSLISIDKFKDEIPLFDIVVIGASIRYGKHSDVVERFISEKQQELKEVESAFFSVNLVARKAGKDRPETNPYLVKFLDPIDWKPDLTEVFAGSLDYRKYSFFDKWMVRAIMFFTNGPVRTAQPVEYTNWERVKSFAKALSLLKEKEGHEAEQEVIA